MTASTERRGLPLALAREEQWVLHHVMLDRLELEAGSPERDRPPMDLYRIFETLEAGSHRFTRRERRRLREELEEYAEARDTPDRDRPIARRVLARLREADPRASNRRT